MKKSLISLTLVFALAVSVFGCGRAKASSSDELKTETASVSMRGGYTNDLAGEVDYYEDVEYLYEDTSLDIEAQNIANTSNTQSDGQDLIDHNGQMIVRTMNITLETELFEDFENNMKDSIARNGGYIESSNVTGTGKDNNWRVGRYTIRIPSDNLDAVRNDLNGTGTVLSSNENATDVSLQYFDLQSHIEALRAEQASLMALLEQADSVETIISLQERLTDVIYDIESYESSLRVLSNQVSFSTLTLVVNEVIEERVVEDTRNTPYSEKLSSGFFGTLKEMGAEAKENFLNFVTYAPRLILTFITLAVIFLIIKIAIRIIKKRIETKKAKKNVITSAPQKPATDNA